MAEERTREEAERILEGEAELTAEPETGSGMKGEEKEGTCDKEEEGGADAEAEVTEDFDLDRLEVLLGVRVEEGREMAEEDEVLLGSGRSSGLRSRGRQKRRWSSVF
jgi:hypothetical protein